VRRWRCGYAAGLAASGLLFSLAACQQSNGASEAGLAAGAEASPGVRARSIEVAHPPRKLPDDPRLLNALGDPARRLLPLLAALEEIETGSAARPVEIIQIGDSHTANASFAGHMRELLQERFGAAGRGMLQPGIPFDYYHPQLATVSENARWSLASSFRQTAAGPWGIAGVRETATRPGDRMTLTSTEDAGFARAFIEILRRPGGGKLDLRVDENPIQPIATNGPAVQAEWREIPVPPGSHTLSLAPHGDGPVELLSWGTERPGPGVLYENFGTIGATVDLVGRWDKAIVKAELAQRDPALIIIAFGTNEGFDSGTDRAAYQQLFSERVRTLKDAAPNAAILVIGPPDGNRLYRRGLGQAGNCIARIVDDTPAAPGGKQGKKAGPHAIWAPPPALAKVRLAQRQAAGAEGWYFWDWSAAMGGACAIHHWTELEPPLAHDDHVHLQVEGYRLGAQQLFDELMAQYDRYRALRPTVAAHR
jgi:hypothetical protein